MADLTTTTRIPWSRFPWFAVMVPSTAWTGVWLWEHRWHPAVVIWIINAVAVGFFALGAACARSQETTSSEAVTDAH